MELGGIGLEDRAAAVGPSSWQRPTRDRPTASGEPPTDAELIARSWAAPEVFEQVYQRHRQVLYRHLFHRVGPDAAADITAEVFAQAFKGRHRYRIAYPSARPWLFGIAANLLRQHFRSRRRTGELARRLRLREAAQTPDAAPDSDQRIDAGRWTQQLASALRSLQHRDREVLIVYAMEDLTYREIAAALDIPIGTVRSRLARARRQMKALVAAENAEISPG